MLIKVTQTCLYILTILKTLDGIRDNADNKNDNVLFEYQIWVIHTYILLNLKDMSVHYS